jgi:predicted nucleotidyltransferase
MKCINVAHGIQQRKTNTVSKTMLQKFKKIALEEAKITIKERPDLIAFFVYGSVARGNPTQSSDIDSISILRDISTPFFRVAKRENVLISKEFHPKTYYQNIEGLTNRVYDAWIIHDPSGFFSRIQQKLFSYFYLTTAKKKRITEHLILAERNLEKSMLAVNKDNSSVPLHLRCFGEHIGLVLHEIIEWSPSMRRFICNIQEISQELDRDDIYLDLVDILGYNDFSSGWMQQAIKGAEGLQRLMHRYPLDEEFTNDKDILHPYLVREYTNGTRELFSVSEKCCLFPCQLYASMVLFRRNPTMKTFFKRSGKNCEMESDKPDYIRNLQRLKFPSEFFRHHSAIFGTEFYGKKELSRRIKIARKYLGSIKELAREKTD